MYFLQKKIIYTSPINHVYAFLSLEGIHRSIISREEEKLKVVFYFLYF